MESRGVDRMYDNGGNTLIFTPHKLEMVALRRIVFELYRSMDYC